MPDHATAGSPRSLWAGLIVLCGLAVLIGLGVWQLQRLAWKEGEIAKRQARAQGPAVTLPADLGDLDALEFTRVRMNGRFDHARELYLGGRVHRKQVGWHVVTPFHLDDGRTVLVDRGWVPQTHRDPATRAAGQLEGQQEVEGFLRRGGWRGWAWFRPANRPEENHWIWPDLAAMAAHTRLERPVVALYVEAAAGEPPGDLPIGGDTPIALRNDHLEYALTWFALAAVLAIIYLLYLRGGRGNGPETSRGTRME